MEKKVAWNWQNSWAASKVPLGRWS
jgi:hypothetical protein